MKNGPLSPPNLVFAAALLLMMGLLAGGAALRESVTIDEVAHVGAGVSYLQKLDMRMNFEHPPLAKVLAGLPLVMRGVRADYSHLSWSFSGGGFGFNSVLGEWSFGHWLLTRWNDPWPTLAWARFSMLLLTLALGFVLYLYASRLGDVRGGLLCLSAFVSTPAFLAFGPLVLTDIAVTLFSVLTLWTLASMWRSPSRAAVTKFALALAGALLSKFSAGLLLVASIAFAVSLRWLPSTIQPGEKAESKVWRRLGWRNTGKGVVGAALMVYAVYVILSWNQPSDILAALGGSPAAIVLRRLLMPIGLYGVGLFAFAIMASRPTFLLGHAYSHGVWFYFPVMFALKSTLAFLGLVLLALGVAIIAKRRQGAEAGGITGGMELHWRATWIFFLVFVMACLASRLDLSIRHFSVPMALMLLMLAPLPRQLESLRKSGWRPARWCLALAVTLAAASVLTAVRAYPYYIPFLNSLSLGHPGYELVNDSNLDWNQALPEVRKFAEQRGLAEILIDEYGYSDPTVYVPQARFWDCQNSSPSDAGRWAVVSANMIIESHNCPWLLAYPRQVLAGGSMYALQLPVSIPPAGSPGGPPLRNAYHNLAGTPATLPDIRLVFLRGIRDPQQLPLIIKEFEQMGPP